jgi:hypothetical protein
MPHAESLAAYATPHEPPFETPTRSQFQPPSASCSRASRATSEPVSTPKYAPAAPTCPLMQGSSSPAKKPFSAHSGGPEPRHVTPACTRPTAARAASLAGSSPRAHSSEHVQRRIPSAIPRRPAEAPVAPLKSEQARAEPLARDARALAGDLVRGRVSQVGEHLPAQRRVAFR